MSSFRKEAIYLIFSIAIIFLFLFGCDRETPTEPVDDGKAPAPPRGLSVFREYDGEVGIEWMKNLESDINHYNIYRKTQSENQYKLIDSTTSLFYVDTKLAYDTTYNYKISVTDVFGMKSELSDSVSALPKNLYNPLPPYYIFLNGRNWDDTLSMKLTFGPSFSSDVDYYEVHRSEIAGFNPDSSTLISETDSLTFIDHSNLELLKEYYYRIISVDKGGLKSSPSSEQNDLILDQPTGVFPENNSELDYFTQFRIKTCSAPADYKIVLQSNEIYGTEIEFSFSSTKMNEVITVPIRNVTFNAYIDYYWRVFTYTKSNNAPNSFSDLFKFRIVPDNQ